MSSDSEGAASGEQARGATTPMTYRAGRKGKQFVVICAGSHVKMGTKIGDYVVALAQP